MATGGEPFVPSLTQLLVQFIFRLTLGMALAMGVTPPRLVTSGYYRVHLWVLMGTNTLAALALYSDRQYEYWTAVMTLAVGLAVGCYVAATMWLYEKSKVGVTLLYAIAIAAMIAAALATNWEPNTSELGFTLGLLDIATGGWLLGVTTAAMLLGHWYLNTPTMELVPLKRLVILVGVAIGLRTLMSMAGLALNVAYGEPLDMTLVIFISLRWLAGLIGAGVLTMMTWQVLKVPNTQSATGILYAGVIVSFIGELTAQLLSVRTMYPV
jgi:hypothetical protein